MSRTTHGTCKKKNVGSTVNFSDDALYIYYRNQFVLRLMKRLTMAIIAWSVIFAVV